MQSALTVIRESLAWAFRPLLAGVVALGFGLALVWVFLVPILQSPDEDAHFDYALSIYAAGHLLRVTDRPIEPDARIRRSNPFAAFLEDRTSFDLVRHSPQVPAPPLYGTGAFYDALNHSAPPVAPQTYNPGLIGGYPFGYYALTAAWMAGVHAVDPQPLALFFGARILSAVLVALNIALSYVLFRASVLSRGRALALTAVVAIFPLTSFVGSYVQPENFAWTSATLCLLAGLRLRERPGSWAMAALLGLSAGILLVTKAHYLPYVAIAALGAAAVPYVRRRGLSWRALLARVPLLALPALVLEAIDLWVTTGRAVGLTSISTSSGTNVSSLVSALHQGPLAAAGYLAGSALSTFFGFFVLGRVSFSFWGFFGWLDAPLLPGSTWNRLVVAAGTLILMALAARRLLAVGLALVRMVRRGRWRWAFEITFSKPAVNAYLMWTVALYTITVVAGDVSVAAQGRFWMPVIAGVFLAATELAPAGLRNRRARAAVSNLVLAGLLLYAVVGAGLALHDINKRYYANGRTYTALAVQSLVPAGAGGDASIDYVIPSDRDFNKGKWPRVVPVGGAIAVGGWALAPEGGPAPVAVFVTVDGSLDVQAVYGDDSPSVRSGLSYAHRAGFDTTIQLAGLAPGQHQLTLKIVAADGRTYYDPSTKATFEVVAPH